MTSLISSAAVAPVFAQSGVRAEQVTQLILGETATLLERTGDWLRVCTHADGYDGWIHSGYLIEVADDAAEEWRSRAQGWSEGAVVRIGGGGIPLAPRARVVLENDVIGLPDGRRGRVVNGCVRDMAEVV